MPIAGSCQNAAITSSLRADYDAERRRSAEALCETASATLPCGGPWGESGRAAPEPSVRWFATLLPLAGQRIDEVAAGALR
jgi:hypothetical protein